MDKTDHSSPRTAIITGANTGVGYAIALRLAVESPYDITIILACRNKAKATEAQSKLSKDYARHMYQLETKRHQQSGHPNTKSNKRVEFVVELVDVGRARSVLAFNARIQQQYRRVDYLFCNAGILPSDGIQWGKLVKEVFTDPLNLVIRADVLMQPKQSLTEDGIGNVFACNVFGHYIMIKGLEDQLSKTAEDPGRVIWTGSMTAEKAHSNPLDFQGLDSTAPYESTKWATDLLAIRLNSEWGSSNSIYSNEKETTGVDLTADEPRTGRLTRSQTRAARATSSSSSASSISSTPAKKRHIVSITTDPGVVSSSMGDFAFWLIWARLLVHYFVRFVFAEGSQTITAYHGANANVVAAFKEPADTIDTRIKIGSRVDRIGREYVSLTPVEDYEDADGKEFVEQVEQLRHKVLAKATATSPSS